MTKQEVPEIFERILSWPPERQADVARLLESIEEQDSDELRLTDEQVSEVRRRRARQQPTYVPLREARAQLHSRGPVRVRRKGKAPVKSGAESRCVANTADFRAT